MTTPGKKQQHLWRINRNSDGVTGRYSSFKNATKYENIRSYGMGVTISVKQSFLEKSISLANGLMLPIETPNIIMYAHFDGADRITFHFKVC